MKTVVELETGTLEVNGNMDGWIITSERATLPAPNDDVVLRKGGAAGRGPAKARTSEQARKAALARWRKRKTKARAKRSPNLAMRAKREGGKA